jgi:hypothetical protein
LTNRPESSVEYRLASSTASLSTTAVGTWGRSSNSNVARRITLRSSTGIRASVHPLALAAMRASIVSRLPSTPRTSSWVRSSGSTTWRSIVSAGAMPFEWASYSR